MICLFTDHDTKPTLVGLLVCFSNTFQIHGLQRNGSFFANTFSARAFITEFGYHFCQVMGAYGYSIEQTITVDIDPDQSVRQAMNEINAGQLSLLKTHQIRWLDKIRASIFFRIDTKHVIIFPFLVWLQHNG